MTHWIFIGATIATFGVGFAIAIWLTTSKNAERTAQVFILLAIAGCAIGVFANSFLLGLMLAFFVITSAAGWIVGSVVHFLMG